jgi:hypothetical protein
MRKLMRILDISLFGMLCFSVWRLWEQHSEQRLYLQMYLLRILALNGISRPTTN